MRIKDLNKTIKARDPNAQTMQDIRRSGAAGAHKDKTKIIPRKQKNQKISLEDKFQQYMEADPNELGAMNDKMRDTLDKVNKDDQDLYKKHMQQREKERVEKAAELGDAGMQDYIAKLKGHDWTYDYSDDHSVWQRGTAERNEIRRLQQILDPNFEVYNKYAPDMYKVKRNPEPSLESKEFSDVWKALEKLDEVATAGSTSAGSIATVANPHIAIGDKKARKAYGGLTNAVPKPPKSKMQKPNDNALDMKGTSIFGGKAIKR